MAPGRGVVRSWFTGRRILAVVAIAWAPIILSLYGPREVGERLGLAISIAFVLGMPIVALYLVVRGALMLVSWPADRQRARWQRRLDARQCPHCGYDVRATPDRCPECGVVPERWWA